MLCPIGALMTVVYTKHSFLSTSKGINRDLDVLTRISHSQSSLPLIIAARSDIWMLLLPQVLLSVVRSM